MNTTNFHDDAHVRALNDFQVQLAIVSDVFREVVHQMDGPEWMTSAARLAQDRLQYLVENTPFPPHQ